MLRIGLGMGPGNASPLVRSRAWDHRSNFKPFARPVWPRMANRSIPPLLWTRFGPMRCCSMWCCLLCAAYYSDCFPHLIFIDKYSRLHAVFWRFQAFHGLRQKCMAVCPGTSCESLSAKCCAKAWSIGGRLDRGRNFFTDFTMISHSPNFSWWLGKPWADASYNMMYCYVSCCCSCSFLGQCGMSIVCRWISGVTTRLISLHLLVPILVPPGMHWSSPMVIPCSTLLAHTCPISSPNPSHTAIGIMGKSHCSLMFTVHHSRLPREENRWHFIYIYIHILYIHFCCKYM